MPIGFFLILLKTESDYEILGHYFKKEMKNFEITSDLILRLTLEHSKNEINHLRLKDFIIFSYLHKFKEKLKSKTMGAIIGLLLKEGDKPENFISSLKDAGKALETIDLLKTSEKNFHSKLKEIYEKHLVSDVIDANGIKSGIIEKTKQLLSGGKKERRIAQELLEKIEDETHLKLTTYYNMAEQAIEESDYDKAAKNFEKASEIALELLEEDLAKLFEERANLSKKIPTLSKKRDKIAQDARNALKNEDFHSACVLYKEASELSKELMHYDREEEYMLKSKALHDFYQIDERFKKKTEE